MKWHDCKISPPKKNKEYLLVYKYGNKSMILNQIITWNKVFYFMVNNEWEIYTGHSYESLDLLYEVFIPIKWAEVNLDEDD